jgi:3-methyl-2-oxobutanoate hydroxymethyltransferase|tara:strand:- start:9233 stop:10033 length:801 start_codon:yes stop_codon:yes gene_type:complete
MRLPKKVTARSLKIAKNKGEKFAVLTSYDATLARLSEEAGIECLLVGDSLGNVMQGQATTVPVTIEDMCYHTSCVANGVEKTMVIGDMPFMTYATPEDAFANAADLMQAGAHMVKMEGGAWLAETISLMTERGIPVCAHVGLLPQSVNKTGGFRLQGKTEEDASQILEDAKILEQAGADMLLLEMIPQALAAKITEALEIPVIGIGAGNQTDAQVLVIYDLLGLSGYIPSFVNNFLEGNGSIQNALSAYAEAVRSGAFPDKSHTPG